MNKRKYSLLICGIFLALSTTSFSQTFFNVKLGTSIANQTNSTGSFRFGYNLGISYEQQFSKVLWLEFGMDYVQKGTHVGVFQNVTQFSRRIQYLEVPIFAKYRYPVSETFVWSLYAGPSFGFATSASSRFFRIAQPIVQPIAIDSDAGINPFDLGLNLGGELSFASEYGYIGLFVTAQQSVSSVLNVNGVALRNYGITTGLKFQFGKPVELEEYDWNKY
jgi:hypothetical protein